MKLKRALERVFWRSVPLSTRRRLAIWLDGRRWLPGSERLAMAVVRDQGESDVNAFHRFLWSNHLGYARLYERANDFGPERLTETRRMLFDHLIEYLTGEGVDPATSVTSVFDVGCSAGYLLRHMETDLFPDAVVLEGIDIDAYAIDQGARYLNRVGSRVRIRCADMVDLNAVMGANTYDVVLCAGVLMYLNQNDAAALVRSMLEHARQVVAIAGLAHPEIDNSLLESSPPRSDMALIHNIDAMVENAGGSVVFRRWEGDRDFGGYSAYFVLARLERQAT
ncbi:MAG: class I SAM-dependent methyltransferase [Acidimicrobiia bacterium]|nr:class I SAM-dependent methyltransferase [Acidimicrobiia bacterium]